MIDPTALGATAADFLHFALVDRILTRVAYDQEGQDSWLRFAFDDEVFLLVDPRAPQTRDDPVPWFHLRRWTSGMGAWVEQAQEPVPPFAPAPPRLQLPPDRQPWTDAQSEPAPSDPLSLSVAGALDRTLATRRVRGVICDEQLGYLDDGARHFQIEFEAGWYLVFDFNPPGERSGQREWIALFDFAGLDEAEGDETG